MFGVALDGRPEGADDGPPKKSRPKRESAGFDDLGGGAVLDGKGRVLGVSVVLGLAGGAGMSPNMSTCGAALVVGPVG